MNWVRHILIFPLRLYQWLLSPLLRAIFGPAGACRFSPSCSHYAVDALQIHGVFKGALLTAGRLCRCHPWGGCGDDPVPLPRTKSLREPHACDCKCPVAGAAGGRH